ncbi:hypothetical protein [Mucilaginibacter phyllosphaerae]|uniref:Uncharacterized protein n=2 Tax=Mucilaginibacter phyllosphaerae TaxID=1812349 RepID=A0ABR6ICS5_9SPHI|nr:hypothetical protein [Mucilaginibacter phyllosphaerae]MBB3970855.1 hypothetical protein [Mucilaginibacter phyllosphaerae]GGH05025.1 hypothetical protein GCM10007352_08570 [Mucilaginibacter phyllosphaerae]
MNFFYKFLTGIAVYILFFNTYVNAQGCVAIRGNGSFLTMEHPMLDTTVASESSWYFTSSYRYFKSFRHFKGTEEQKQRQTLHNEVVNFQNTIDLALTRNFNKYWSVTVGIPYLINTRSSLYEHGGAERNRSYSHGFGDARIVGNRWLFDSHTAKRGNIQIGLGVKLPTGNYNYMSEFKNVTPSERPVDQSIQLGDGGVGIIAEINGFMNFGSRFGGYTNLYYMANPRNTNGTRTYRETLRATLANESIMSVPDQFLARLGVNYTLSGAFRALTVSAGGRIEGIPVRDLIGKSDAFRRPGYVLSVEPSLNYSFKRFNLFANVPIAVKRDRTQSVTDKENSVKSGTYVIGDAAFADYSLNFGVSFKL